MTTLIDNVKIITLDNQGTIENGYILIKGDHFQEVSAGHSSNKCDKKIDGQGMVVMPGFVDCHTHLMEYATAELHQTQGPAQRMAGIANLLIALKSGIVAVGEHHLGHPVLNQTTKEYQVITNNIPIDVKLAVGCCFIGTDPLTLVSSTHPGRIIDKDKDLTGEEIKHMAINSDFPGENIFLNATVANLPLSAAPKAGHVTFNYEDIETFVRVFHSYGKKIGAHIEGDIAAEMFINAGGDVIHHGHGISNKVAELMAKKNVSLVVTPHGGTSSVPLSPEEVYQFYKLGVNIAIASDSYLPPHPMVTWLDLPQDYLVGPEDFLKITRPFLKYFLDQGELLEDTLKLITVNGRRLLSNNKENGTITSGNKADCIICQQIPGIGTIDTTTIKYVIKNGHPVVVRE